MIASVSHTFLDACWRKILPVAMVSRAVGTYLVLFVLLAEFCPQQCFLFGSDKESNKKSFKHKLSSIFGGGQAGAGISLTGGAGTGGLVGVKGGLAAGASVTHDGAQVLTLGHTAKGKHSAKVVYTSHKKHSGTVQYKAHGKGGHSVEASYKGFGKGKHSKVAYKIHGKGSHSGVVGYKVHGKGSHSGEVAYKVHGKGSLSGGLSYNVHGKGSHSGEVKYKAHGKGKHSGKVHYKIHGKGKHSGEAKYPKGKHGKHSKGKSKEAKSKEIIIPTQPPPTPAPTTTTTTQAPTTKRTTTPEPTTRTTTTPNLVTIENQMCMIQPEARMDCGFSGISEQECTASLGCCYDDGYQPACFYAKDIQRKPNVETKVCEVGVAHRRQCGETTIAKSLCLKKSCCYDESLTGLPNCFYPADQTAKRPAPIQIKTTTTMAPTKGKSQSDLTTTMEGLLPALTATTSAIPSISNLLVIYDGKKFEDDYVSFHEDTPNLGDFDDRCSSIIVYGPALWQVFEHPNYKGRSVVLESGNYSTTALLPFGNNGLSSARMVFSVDVPRTEITGVGRIVCFERQVNRNYVWGLISRAAIEARISVFHFGFLANDIDACEKACREEPRCAAYSLFLTSYKDSNLAGNCYGRGFHEDTDVIEEGVVGGIVASGDKEDTITVFDKINFEGSFTTITTNVNISTPVITKSVIITGKDTWYIKIQRGTTSYSVVTLSPGKFPDVTSYIPHGSLIVSVTKTDPMSVLDKYDLKLDLDLAPNAIRQISDKLPETKPELEKDCTTTQQAEIVFILDRSGSVGKNNFKKVKLFVNNITESFDIAPNKVRVGAMAFSTKSAIAFKLNEYSEKKPLQERISDIDYTKGWTYTNRALEMLRTQLLNDKNTRPGIPKVAIVVTDGKSTTPNKTDEEAHRVRDDGIALTAVGIKGADYDELVKMTGDKSRVFNIDDFDKLGDIVESVKKTTCKVVKQQEVAEAKSQHAAVTVVQGDDEHYFFHELPQYKRLPDPLGLESGLVIDAQIFASSAKNKHPETNARLNCAGGWMPWGSIDKKLGHYIEVDFGTILPIHGVGTQGHSELDVWVTKYKLATSLDGVTFVNLKEKTNNTDLVFVGNVDRNTVKHHCLHRLFGDPIKARVVRFIPIKWHHKIGFRFEVYGFRDIDDTHLLEAMKKDVWTRNVTGCPCYHNPLRKNCACCEEGGCQCGGKERHQCVQCGYPHNCGKVSLRDRNNNVDGWTRSQSGCRCMFDLKSKRTDCACCQNGGCQCAEGNHNQCVNCAHPQHCGLKEHIFGPNPYCVPKSCMKNGQA